MLMKWGLISQPIEFWANSDIARPLVILINIWIGIPYLMLMATGILMNIPADLYESSKIDGANAYQQFTKITLPYMLFVTGPYLLTSFIGNINNFNVIFLLTGGSLPNPDLATSGGSATDYDLLITWIYSMVTGVTSNYKLSAVIAIMIFVVVATLSVIVYNVMPSTRNEEDFQ
jgi:arabinogalactan oligomer/maltooligosaccharide transport system permease protein